MTPPPAELGSILLALARDAITQRLGGAAPIFLQVMTEGNPLFGMTERNPLSGMTAEEPQDEATAALPEAVRQVLDAPGASFVTLKLHERLHGCIGSLEAYRPLRLDLTENAQAAAFRDPRFAPLTAEELAPVRIEVSLLSAPAPMQVRDEADALCQLRPTVDGLILSLGQRRATFLPQVWDELPDPADFLARLKQKAGLPAVGWPPAIQLARYQVTKWKES